MKSKKIIPLKQLSLSLVVCMICLQITNISFSQWTTSGSDIYNSNSGNVSIGSSGSSFNSMTAKFAVTGSVGTFMVRDDGLQAYFTGNAGGFNYFGTNANSGLQILTNNATRMTFDTYGNVGIGTTGSSFNSMTAKFAVTGSVGTFMVRDDGLQAYFTGNAGGFNYFGTNANSGLQILTNNATRMTFDTYGNVGIGTTTPSEKFSVNGNILAKKLIVTQLGWSDDVFDKKYKLRSLSFLESFINQNKHLPEVPSAKEVEEKGISVGDNQALLLKKIEELTLYMIEMHKKNTKQQNEIDALKSKIASLQK